MQLVYYQLPAVFKKIISTLALPISIKYLNLQKLFTESFQINYINSQSIKILKDRIKYKKILKSVFFFL